MFTCKLLLFFQIDNFQFEVYSTNLQLNVFASRYSNYEVLIQPNSDESLGKFQCSIAFNSKRNGGYELRYFSNDLDTNSIVGQSAIVPFASVNLSVNKENENAARVKCNLNLTPNFLRYKVTFEMDDKPLAEYSVIRMYFFLNKRLCSNSKICYLKVGTILDSSLQDDSNDI